MTSWMIPTHNDPLGAVRQVIAALWEAANLERILLPQNGATETTGPRVIANPQGTEHFNPFIPLMPFNAAQLVPELVAEGTPVAAVLRPCELRTLRAMERRGQLRTHNLLTVSVDCLGTLPPEEFARRAQREGSSQDTLQSASQGNSVSYRYRTACQICQSPEACEAEVNIAVLGLPVRQYILLNVRREALATRLRGEEATPVDETLLAQHQRVTARLVERGQSTRQRIFRKLTSVLPATIEALTAPIKGCDDCRACFDACPLCTSQFPQRDAKGNYTRTDVLEWLVSCAGCGMCEQACPKHLPLTLTFAYIREQLTQPL